MTGGMVAEQPVPGCAEQYLTFSLGGEEYGVDILRVQEIRGWNEVRSLPNTPDYVKGVLNLRGRIVPIIDLRTRFHLQDVQYRPTTVTIVLGVEGDGEERWVGIVVDAVSDVLDVGGEDFHRTPSLGSQVDTRFIQGMAMDGERMVVLLDGERLLDPDELSALERLG